MSVGRMRECMLSECWQDEGVYAECGQDAGVIISIFSSFRIYKYLYSAKM